MRYELKREDVFDFARAIGAETHQRGDELEFSKCPYCHGGSKSADKDTFSINLKSGAFKCMRASCGHEGHFVELCRDFDYRLDFEQPKVFRKLPQKKIVSADSAVEYMKSRGISEAVTRKYHVTAQAKRPNILAFPFYDETGKLVCVKYRKTDFKKGVDKSKEWFESDTMPILFGMDQCLGFDRLVITEGQIDSLSVAEAGIKNAVSVPNGASGFTWLTYCADWMSRWKEIVVFGDCEHGHITLLDTLTARLPNTITVKAVRMVDYLGEKDANDILRTYGPRAVAAAVERAETPRIENVKDLADVQSVDLNKMDKILTGISEVDRTIRGMAMGQLVLLTGKRGEGKSTLMSQIVAEALNQNRRVFVYSGELADFHFKRWLDLQIAGSANVVEETNGFGDKDYTLAPETVAAISEWYRGRAYIYDNGFIRPDGSELESLPDTIERVIRDYNVQLICIDNLMTAMENVNDQNNLYLAQSNFVGRLKAIAAKYSVVVLLVAHPRKNSGGDDNDSISGAAEITNKADIVMTYNRGVKDEESGETDYSGGQIKIIKNRLTGDLRATDKSAVRVTYAPKSKRLYDTAMKSERVYGWARMALRQQTDDSPADLPF